VWILARSGETTKIIIKALQSGIKSLIAVAFINHLKQNLGGCATSDTIMQTNVGQLAPDETSLRLSSSSIKSWKFITVTKFLD
jgi:hypothetical protein